MVFVLIVALGFLLWHGYWYGVPYLRRRLRLHRNPALRLPTVDARIILYPDGPYVAIALRNAARARRQAEIEAEDFKWEQANLNEQKRLAKERALEARAEAWRRGEPLTRIPEKSTT